jgi:tripartite-type tricarboxylate transporter receptor subunit TctC
MKISPSRLATCAAVAIAVSFPHPREAAAQSFPSRPVTIIAATAPGGPGDIAARLIGERMATALGQPVVIENVAGAGGIQGTARVARAEPDGYTLLVHQTGIAIAPAVSGNLSFSVEKDLTTVGLVNNSYLVLVGRKGLPAADFKSLVAWMKTPGQRTRFAHPGTGTLGQVSTVVFARQIGAEIDAVPYRGVAPAVNDMLGEHVDLVWLGAVAAAPLIAAGKINAYAVGGPKRLATMPDVLSATEVAMPSLDMPFWHALFAPSATPKAVIEKLDAALSETLADPGVIAAYDRTGVEAFPANMRSAAVAHAFVRSEIARWRNLVP